MILPNPRSNDPLTPEQIAVLRESISARHKDTKNAKESIENEQLKLSMHSAAIAHLEPAILRAKQVLIAQEKLLIDFREMENEMKRVYALPGPDWEIISEARRFCLTAMTALDTQKRKLVEDASQLEEHLSHLRLTIQEMEVELSSRQLMQAMSSQHISDTEKHKQAIEENIGVLKSWLNHVKNIPAEIWAKIFSLRMRADMAAFFASAREESMPITAVWLSHVSRFWRGIVLSQRSLVQFVPIDKHNPWPHSNLELPSCFTGCSGQDTTLVYSLPDRDTVDPDEISMLGAYSLHIVTDGRNENVSSIPFRQPKILKLQFPAEPEGLETLLDTFSEISSLEIINKDHHQPTEFALSAIQQQLIYLKLDMTTFEPFDVTGNLGSNLEELHIRHHGISYILTSTTMRLPQLKVLGVTPPDTDFTHSLDLPALKKITMYGPRSLEIGILSLVQLADSPNFKRVRDVELREWPLLKPGTGDAWSIMTPVGSIVDKMRSIESFRCVDSVINGSGLVKLVSALKDTTKTTDSKLDNVVIDCCTGITRDQCNAVGALVCNMEVYV